MAMVVALDLEPAGMRRKTGPYCRLENSYLSMSLMGTGPSCVLENT